MRISFLNAKGLCAEIECASNNNIRILKIFMELGLWQQMLFIEFKYKDCVLIIKADLNFLNPIKIFPKF